MKNRGPRAAIDEEALEGKGFGAAFCVADEYVYKGKIGEISIMIKAISF